MSTGRLEDMKMAEFHLEPGEWGEEEDNTSDWNIIQTICCFSHKEACEFILFVGDDTHIDYYKNAGLSDLFLDACNEAQKEGYKYICFYS